MTEKNPQMCMDCGKLESEGAEFARSNTKVRSPFCKDCARKRGKPTHLFSPRDPLLDYDNDV